MRKIIILICVSLCFVLQVRSQDQSSFGTIFNLKMGVGIYPSVGMTFNLSKHGSAINAALAMTILEFGNCIRPEFVWDYEGRGAGIFYHKKWIGIGIAYMWQRYPEFKETKILLAFNP